MLGAEHWTVGEYRAHVLALLGSPFSRFTGTKVQMLTGPKPRFYWSHKHFKLCCSSVAAMLQLCCSASTGATST